MIKPKIKEEFKTHCFLCKSKLSESEIKDINKDIIRRKRKDKKDEKNGLPPKPYGLYALFYVCDACVEYEYISTQQMVADLNKKKRKNGNIKNRNTRRGNDRSIHL